MRSDARPLERPADPGPLTDPHLAPPALHLHARDKAIAAVGSNPTIRRFYSDYWRHGQTLRDRLWRAWWQEAYEQMLTWAGPLAGRRVLVVFAGLGEDVAMLAQRGANVVALDFALSGLAQARRATRAPCICADATELPLASGSCDLVFVLNGICHTDKVRVLAESRRILQPDGRIFLLEVLRYPHVAVAARLLEPYLWRAPHKFLSVRELERLGQAFPMLRHRQFFVLSVLSAMLLRLPLGARLFHPLHRLLTRLDRPLLRALPILRHISYLTVAELRLTAE